MHRILASLTILLLVGVEPALAVRVLELVERSYELRLADVTLPRSAVGSVTFKVCPECTIESVPVTTGTRYFIGKQEATLAELTEQTRLASQRSGTGEPGILMVHYDIDTKRATRLVLRTF